MAPRGRPRKAAKAARFFFAAMLVFCAGRSGFATSDDDPLAMEFVPPDASRPVGRAASERWAIYLNGRIDDRAAERFREELTRREIRSASVYLNSRGGDLSQGMELGALIRERGFSTNVGSQNDRGALALAGECYSACVLAFIGGNYRFCGSQSRIGVHRFSALSPTGSDLDTAQIVSAAIVNYIRLMDVDVGLFDRMSRAGKDEMLVLAKADLERLRVINNGRQAAEWTIESLNGTSHLKGSQQTWLGEGEIRFSCNQGQVVFHPMFDAGDNAEAVRDSVKQHLIRFGDRYVPLADPLQPVSIQDGRVSAEFVLNREQIDRLRATSSVGYAARLGYPNVFAGFSVDTQGPAGEKINSFLRSCER